MTTAGNVTEKANVPGHDASEDAQAGSVPLGGLAARVMRVLWQSPTPARGVTLINPADRCPGSQCRDDPQGNDYSSISASYEASV